jgi:hypothetical protein
MQVSAVRISHEIESLRNLRFCDTELREDRQFAKSIINIVYGCGSYLNQAMERPSASLISDVDETLHGGRTEQPPSNPRNLSKAIASDAFQSVQLEFIISSSSPGELRADHNSSRIIRSHAMRHHIRQTKLLSGSDIAGIQPSKPNLSKGAVGRFKLSTWSRASSKAKKTAKDGTTLPVTASFTIPEELGLINILPIDHHPHTARLLFHCTCLGHRQSLMRQTCSCYCSRKIADLFFTMGRSSRL